MKRYSKPLLLSVALSVSLFGISLCGRLSAAPAPVRRKPAPLNAQILPAVKAGQAGAVVALLARGASVNARDGDGETLLILASERGEVDIVRLLLRRGADIKAATREGDTALLAVSAPSQASIGDFTGKLRARQIGIMKLLLDAGADPRDKDADGDTALLGVSFDRNVEIARLLLDKGADVNARDKNGDTPLIRGALGDAFLPDVSGLDFLTLLVAHGADVNAADGLGETALLSAVESRDADEVKFLLSHGARTDAVSRMTGPAETPLIRARRTGDDEIIDLLTQAGRSQQATPGV